MKDTHARRTPYEIVFAESIGDRLFPPIAEEAEARGLPLLDPDRFLFLSSVGQLLRRIAGEEVAPEAGYGSADDKPPAPSGAGAGATGEPPGEPGEEPGEEMRQHGRLLYHAFHFWRSGKSVFAAEPALARRLVDDVTSVGEWELRAPHPAGYLQLPRNLFWAAPAPGLPPEPADGFFWTMAGAQGDDDAASLNVLVALGLRPDRAGFSVVPAEGTLDDVPHWAESQGRPAGEDFESTIPGGELDRLYSLETATEVLKLASRFFWHVSAYPETLGPEERAPDDAEPDDPRLMPPSSLAYRRLRSP